MSKTRNLGELFHEAIRKHPTEKQKHKKRTRTHKNNTTGIMCVSVVKCKGCTQGFMYQYSKTVNHNRNVFKSVDILKLKQKALRLGLEWEVFNKDLAMKTAENVGITYEELVKT